MPGFLAVPRMRVKLLLGVFLLPCLVVAGLADSDLRLIDAVKKRNIEAVGSLLKQSVDVNASQGDGATALHWAAYLDDPETTDLLLRAGARVKSFSGDCLVTVRVLFPLS